ncbi:MULTISPECIES: ATP-binding protein [Bacillus]|uniref:ATP-binding protein n=1 Tax=Bacillus TaxID=1386 RepID=UPI00037E6E96|nr:MULTISPECIES: sensor histidine kinase [Bacillus]
MRRISINWKIMALTFFVIAFSFLVAGIFVLGNVLDIKEKELSTQAMLMARTVSELPEVQKYLKEGSVGENNINPIVEKIRVINKADYIVVLNMDRIRLSHPVKKMIGTKSKTADESAAFVEHTYTSKAKGEVGTVVRAFVPIIDEQHKQIGVVVCGYLLPTIWEIIMSIKKEILITTMFSLIFGGWGAWSLARHMKRQMFGLEPHEIAKIYVERNETFNAMHEGIIAIDNHLKVTIFNNKAKKILGVNQKGDLIGMSIYEILPDSRLPEILDYNYPIYNKELQINNHNILSNRIPIEVNNRTVGAVAVFQDRTEVKKLAEELTGVKAFVQALRIQNHEHKNKLHTIAGLLQLGNYDHALEYIFQVKEEQEELTKFLNEKIKDDNLSGLLLSKIGHGKELGIKVEIDRHSQLTSFPKNLDQHDFVIIIGNLINNAFDAFQTTTIEDKKVFISIDQDEALLSLLVEDNGIGMDEQTVQQIFKQGFSTKGGIERGIGLYLINEIVKKGKGTIEVDSIPNEGTSFLITFDM